MVESREESRLWAELIERHHYLEYRVLVGANLRYLVRSGKAVLACLLWSSPVWKMAATVPVVSSAVGVAITSTP